MHLSSLPPAPKEWSQSVFGPVLYMYGTRRAVVGSHQTLWILHGKVMVPYYFCDVPTHSGLRTTMGPKLGARSHLKCWRGHHRAFCGLVALFFFLLHHAVFEFHAIFRRLFIPSRHLVSDQFRTADWRCGLVVALPLHSSTSQSLLKDGIPVILSALLTNV